MCDDASNWKLRIAKRPPPGPDGPKPIEEPPYVPPNRPQPIEEPEPDVPTPIKEPPPGGPKPPSMRALTLKISRVVRRVSERPNSKWMVVIPRTTKEVI